MAKMTGAVNRISAGDEERFDRAPRWCWSVLRVKGEKHCPSGRDVVKRNPAIIVSIKNIYLVPLSPTTPNPDPLYPVKNVGYGQR
jgi:hypothetical protein